MYKMVVLWQCQPVCWAQDICTALYNGCSNLAKLKWSVYCHGNCSILDDKNGSKNVFFKDCVVQTEETTNPFRSRVECVKELLIFLTLHWIIQHNRVLLAGTDFNSRTEIKKMKGSDWLMKRVYWCLLFSSKQNNVQNIILKETFLDLLCTDIWQQPKRQRPFLFSEDRES